MRSHSQDSARYLGIPMITLCVFLLAMMLSATSIHAAPPLSTLAVQLGNSATSGDWYEDRDGGMNLQVSVRVQMYRHGYFGLSYIRQSMSPPDSVKTGGWYYPYISGPTVYPENYHQHEVYAMFGIRSGTSHPRQRYLFAEIGGGVVVYTQEDLNRYEYKESNNAGVGARFSCGLVQPIIGRLGVIVEASGRYTSDHRYDGDSRAGHMIGASAGLIFMTGK